jgi:amidase
LAVHRFSPTHYHVTIGSHEPVLRIAPGDTVIAATADAAGRDAAGDKVAEAGNPMTGPFYIEGAEQGDTLVVHLDRITPSRAHGFTSTVLAPNVVDPEVARALPDRANADWQFDLTKNTATLLTPETRLGRLSLPLAPMVGCFGVAPARGEAISTATSAQHGGNMDYRGFAPGVTVYFPVFVPGALFHLGDGHALQGDGEIVGTGIETSMEMEFTVQLQKGKTIGWPRGETAERIFTVGNARPLDQALQHATTEMLHWLAEDYQLDHTAASILLGQCVEYAVGNVFDPAYTMVCLLRKSLLEGLA